MIDLSTIAIPDLINILRRNTSPLPTTYGECSQKCGGWGRGCGPCWNCVRVELVRRRGEEETARACAEIQRTWDRFLKKEVK